MAFAFPLGVGVKYAINDRINVGAEITHRFTSTDYLDDVSKTYVNLKALTEGNGPKARELSYRKDVPFAEEGERRGNSKVKDSYFFAGIKLARKLGPSSYDEYTRLKKNTNPLLAVKF